MNIERLKQLADYVRKYDEGPVDNVGFNMGTWWYESGYAIDWDGNECGTAGCLAAFAVEMFGTEPLTSPTYWIEERAAELLDLSRPEADELFLPNEVRLDINSITPSQAAYAIERLINGKHPWP